MSEFMAMGGYGAFVWPAFAISIVVLIAMAAQSVIAYRRERDHLAAGQGRASRPGAQ